MRRGPQGPFCRQRPQRHHVQAVVKDSPPLARRRARHFEDGAVGGVIRCDCGREDRGVFWGLDGRARDFDVFLDTGQRVLDDLHSGRVHNYDRAVPVLDLKAHADAVVVVVDDDAGRCTEAIREAYAREQAAAASPQPQGAAKAASWKRKRLFGDATNTAPPRA